MNLETLIWIIILILPAILQLLGKRKQKPSPAEKDIPAQPRPTIREHWEEEKKHRRSAEVHTAYAHEEHFEHHYQEFHHAKHMVAPEPSPEPTPAPHVPSPWARIQRLPRLQQMIVWREILGPPRSRTGPRPPLAG